MIYVLICTHVYLRNDTIPKPLQQPYDGPFIVIRHTYKHFKIQGNNFKVVSIERHKPVYIDTSIKTDTSPTSNSFPVDTSPV